jgi:hypothetical protein
VVIEQTFIGQLLLDYSVNCWQLHRGDSSKASERCCKMLRIQM